MALDFQGQANAGNIEIYLQLDNNASGSFGLYYAPVGQQAVPIPAQHTWPDHAYFVIPPMPNPIFLLANAYVTSAAGGNLFLTPRQGLQILPVIPGSNPAGPAPLILGQAAAGAPAGPFPFAIML